LSRIIGVHSGVAFFPYTTIDYSGTSDYSQQPVTVLCEDYAAGL
jgi:hypothetical protein